MPLQRRHDLVPMLVESVHGYANHERQLLDSIALDRSAALRADTLAQRMAPEIALGRQLDRLMALGEVYPELKASGNFSQAGLAAAPFSSRRQAGDAG